MQWKLKDPAMSQNRVFSGWRLLLATAQYYLTGDGPMSAATFKPNYRATEADRAAMIGAILVMREYAAQAPLASLIAEETLPGPAYQSDAEILDAYDRFGTCGYHAVGSCRMGADAASVVDPALRVRGTEGLRVIDTAIMLAIPSGNTNGPAMAMAWRAADIILRDAPGAGA